MHRSFFLISLALTVAIAIAQQSKPQTRFLTYREARPFCNRSMSLALSNIESLLRDGGFLLSNNALHELPANSIKSVDNLTVAVEKIKKALAEKR
jgi:hypothetical protein